MKVGVRVLRVLRVGEKVLAQAQEVQALLVPLVVVSREQPLDKGLALALALVLAPCLPCLPCSVAVAVAVHHHHMASFPVDSSSAAAAV